MATSQATKPGNSSPHGPLRVGIGGPVGSGKTALMDLLCKSMRDLVRIRRGDFGRVPDLVVYPADEEQVEAVLRIGLDSDAVLIPFGGGSNSRILAALAAAPKPRRFPIDVSAVMGPVEMVNEFRVRLPEGYRARLPQPVKVEGEFGSYATEYAVENGELRVVRRTSGRRGTLPPDRIGALEEWLRATGRDDARFIVLEKGQ